MEFYNRFNVRVLNTDEDFEKYYELRYHIYCKKFGWIAENVFELERDRYDQQVDFAVGVFDWQTDKIMGGHRCIRWREEGRSQFMFQREYERIFNDIEIEEGAHVGEFSRWTIHDDFIKALMRRDQWRGGPSVHLFKMDFLESKQRSIQKVYTHSYPTLIRALNKRGFPFHRIAIRSLANGEQIELALMDWDEFEHLNQDTELLTWFNAGFRSEIIYDNPVPEAEELCA